MRQKKKTKRPWSECRQGTFLEVGSVLINFWLSVGEEVVVVSWWVMVDKRQFEAARGTWRLIPGTGMASVVCGMMTIGIYKKVWLKDPQLAGLAPLGSICVTFWCIVAENKTSQRKGNQIMYSSNLMDSLLHVTEDSWTEQNTGT